MKSKDAAQIELLGVACHHNDVIYNANEYTKNQPGSKMMAEA